MIIFRIDNAVIRNDVRGNRSVSIQIESGFSYRYDGLLVSNQRSRCFTPDVRYFQENAVNVNCEAIRNDILDGEDSIIDRWW